MGARSYTLLINKQLIINQLDRDKGKGASGAGEAPVRWRRTRAIRSRRRPSPYTFLTTTFHHQSLPHHFQPGPKHSPRHSRPDRESLPRLPLSHQTITPLPHARQTAAHRHPPGGPAWPTAVRHRPKSAPGAPQPSAQRTEWPFPCACLAERTADFSTRYRSVEMTRGSARSISVQDIAQSK